MHNHIAYIGMGSNLANPEQQIQQAGEHLHQLAGSHCLALSPLYRSKAIGPGDQPDYINAVAKLDTHLSALALLDALQAIELRQKRVRHERWGPRTLDLDLLLYDQEQISHPRLLVPHPRMAERNFVLAPLVDLAPDLSLPDGTSIASLLKTCGTNDLTRLQPAI